MRRTGKFYRTNEKEVMEELGLKPTINSGSGWIEKEDGQDENILCQLKSTDANSIKINKQDLDTLLYNAHISHKLPLFAIQFIQSNETYLVIKPTDLSQINDYLAYGRIDRKNKLEINLEKNTMKRKNKLIKSDSNAREQFNKLNEERYKKKERKAK